MERFLGDSLNVNRARGFCFVCDANGSAYFLHFKEIHRDANSVQIIPGSGDLFLFSVRDSVVKPGKLEAYNAELARRAKPGSAIALKASPTPVESAVPTPDALAKVSQ